MNKKFLLFEGKKGKGSGETDAEVLNLSKRVYDDFYGENCLAPSHKSPNIEKVKQPIFSQKHLRERGSKCLMQF